MIRKGWIATLLFVFLSAAAHGADCTPAEWLPGTWSGTLAQIGLTLNFHFEADDDGCLTGVFDSPDQGAAGLPLSAVVWDGEQLEVRADNFGFSYTAKRDGESLDGEFFQGAALPLTLTRTAGG